MIFRPVQWLLLTEYLLDLHTNTEPTHTRVSVSRVAFDTRAMTYWMLHHSHIFCQSWGNENQLSYFITMPFCANETRRDKREMQHLDENAPKLILRDVLSQCGSRLRYVRGGSGPVVSKQTNGGDPVCCVWKCAAYICMWLWRMACHIWLLFGVNGEENNVWQGHLCVSDDVRIN